MALEIAEQAVSTHSRLKAAGIWNAKQQPSACCFNTQPPEGGWAARMFRPSTDELVSTHSRLKAAGQLPKLRLTVRRFQHTAA